MPASFLSGDSGRKLAALIRADTIHAGPGIEIASRSERGTFLRADVCRDWILASKVLESRPLPVPPWDVTQYKNASIRMGRGWQIGEIEGSLIFASGFVVDGRMKGFPTAPLYPPFGCLTFAFIKIICDVRNLEPFIDPARFHN